MNRVLSVFLDVHDGLFFKDVFQFPIKVAEAENAKIDHLLTTSISDDLVASSSRLSLKTVKKTKFLKRSLPVLRYLLSEAKSYDLLVLFHVRNYSLFNALLFTKLNPNGKVIIKADRGNLSLASQGILRKGYVRRVFEKLMLRLFKPNQLSISYETDTAKEIARSLLPANIDVIRTYNGHNIPAERMIVPFEQKRNSFVIVGAIGDKRKNHTIILDAIESILQEDEVVLEGWDFKFVGNLVNPDFAEAIKVRAQRYPFFSHSVQLLGSKNKSELYDLYDQSKYMILSSLHEGSPLIIPESLRFGNVILSTPVSSVPELIRESGYVSDSFSAEDMKAIIKAAIIEADENQHKSAKAYKFGLSLEWKELDYSPQLSDT